MFKDKLRSIIEHLREAQDMAPDEEIKDKLGGMCEDLHDILDELEIS